MHTDGPNTWATALTRPFKDLRLEERHAVIAQVILLRFVHTDWHPQPDVLVNTVRACVSVATGESYKPMLIACQQPFEVPESLTVPWYASFDPEPAAQTFIPPLMAEQVDPSQHCCPESSSEDEADLCDPGCGSIAVRERGSSVTPNQLVAGLKEDYLKFEKAAMEGNYSNEVVTKGGVAFQRRSLTSYVKTTQI